MITSNLVQINLISWMKANANIVASIPQGAEEIREKQWRGTRFLYPNIRVKVSMTIPILSADCDVSRSDVSVEVNSNSASSLEAETIAATLVYEMHRKKFTRGIQFVVMSCVSQPQTEYIEGEGVWRSKINFQTVVS